jgi:hypothetical protein
VLDSSHISNIVDSAAAAAAEAQLAEPASGSGSSSNSSGASYQQLLLQQKTVPQAQGRKKSARFGGECLPAHQGEVCRKDNAAVGELAGQLVQWTSPQITLSLHLHHQHHHQITTGPSGCLCYHCSGHAHPCWVL